MKLKTFLDRWSPWRLHEALERSATECSRQRRRAEEAVSKIARLDADKASIEGDFDRIRDRAMRVAYERSERQLGRYSIRVDFTPELLGYGQMGDRALEYMSESVARQIAYEIRTCRFLQSDYPQREHVQPFWPEPKGLQ